MKKKIVFGIIFVAFLGSICFFRILNVKSSETGHTTPLNVMDNWEIYFTETLKEENDSIICENVAELKKMNL